MTIYVTADLHLNHVKVANLRGFESPQEHDRVILQRWNEAVRSEDTVYILGDVAMGREREGTIETFLREANGTKILILGNHERAHPSNRNGIRHQWSLRNFDAVGLHSSVNYKGGTYLLSHLPYAGTDHTEESRFDQWRLPDLGTPLLHGHTHSSERVTYSPAGTPQVCVGLEAWGLAPVSLGEAVSSL